MTSRGKSIGSTAAVIGGGPAGLAAAILLARAGVATALFAPPPPAPDRNAPGDARTAALMAGSIRMLERIGVWSKIRPDAAPLWRLRILDDTGRPVRAPEAEFDAHELGAEPFGWNIPLAALARALLEVAGEGLTLHETAAAKIELFPRTATITGADGTQVSASCIIAADGRNSLAREAAGIRVDRRPGEQDAIIASFAHSLPHDDISSEIHRPGGPLTTVPLPGNRSSLVWVERRDDAAALAQLDDRAFAGALGDAMHYLLGDISDVRRAGVIAIEALTARHFARNRTLLVGEAGHVLPPIGAQGLNLGLRDGALAAELIAEACGRGDDPGDERVTSAYHRRRRGDVLTRTSAVDLLNRSLLSESLPLQGLRGAGLAILRQVAPVRRRVMRHGIGADGDLPRIMRP